MNLLCQNIDGIDLIDHKNKVVVQVSSTCTRDKIESSLSKDVYTEYKDIAISLCLSLRMHLLL